MQKKILSPAPAPALGAVLILLSINVEFLIWTGTLTTHANFGDRWQYR